MTDFLRNAVGHISGLSVKMSRNDTGTFGDVLTHCHNRTPWRHEAITTDQYHLSLRHYKIPHGAVILPHNVVKLHLDLSGGRLIGCGGVRRNGHIFKPGIYFPSKFCARMRNLHEFTRLVTIFQKSYSFEKMCPILKQWANYVYKLL